MADKKKQMTKSEVRKHLRKGKKNKESIIGKIGRQLGFGSDKKKKK